MREKILEVIFRAIDEVNDALPPKNRLAKSPDTTLFGEGATLDSIGLVNLIVATEQRLLEDLDVSVTIANERAISREKSPFRSVDMLAEYVEELIEESS
ncbi:MAG: hypothetical protein KAT30_09250 [Candidatus Krumholzibacteria bacterium]|nr:hypothetical protein [Candidatus Krumholzibacteria bacterium]